VDPSADWDFPVEIRCDDAVRDVTGKPDAEPAPGCVIPSIMPVAEMSTLPYVRGDDNSGQGAAAAAYWWAQQNLYDAWDSRAA
jgi:hypothetical protein